MFTIYVCIGDVITGDFELVPLHIFHFIDDANLSSYVQQISLELLPGYLIAGCILVFIGALLSLLEPARRWMLCSAGILGLFVGVWAIVLILQISPSGYWDIPALCLAWTSMLFIPLSVMTLVIQGIKYFGSGSI